MGEIGQSALEFAHSKPYGIPPSSSEQFKEQQRATTLKTEAENSLSRVRKILDTKTLVLYFEDCQVIF